MMNPLTDRFGICSWSLHPKTPQDLIAGLQAVGLRKVQLALNPLVQNPAVWGQAPARLAQAGISIVSGMFGTAKENYATLETIRQTGGFVPDATWPDNWKHIQTIATVAGDLGLQCVSGHAGFIPPEAGSEAFRKLSQRVGQVADCFAQRGLTLLLETGQETATTLDQFLGALQANGHTNVAVNFDPANMILYDKGDPIAALKQLMPHVRQVHIKDARRTATPGTWGKEVPVGQGEVDWPAFLKVLQAAGYQGNLVVEREAGQDRCGEIALAVTTLSTLLGANR